MDTRLKNILGIVAGVCVIGLAYAAISYSDAFSKSISPSSFRSFAVSGEGKSVSIPDIAQFAFSVITQGGKDIGSLQSDNTAKMNKIISFLKSEGIDEKDIKTENYSVDPRYQYYNCKGGAVCPPADIVGYTITQGVSVKIRDFGKIGDILAGAVSNGANNVSQLSFDIDNKDKVESDARAEAIKKAQAKAQEVAQAGGFKLGKLLSIDESPSPRPIYYNMAKSAGGLGMGAAEVSPNIEPGSQETTVDVTLRYEIQ